MTADFLHLSGRNRATVVVSLQLSARVADPAGGTRTVSKTLTAKLKR